MRSREGAVPALHERMCLTSTRAGALSPRCRCLVLLSPREAESSFTPASSHNRITKERLRAVLSPLSSYSSTARTRIFSTLKKTALARALTR